MNENLIYILCGLSVSILSYAILQLKQSKTNAEEPEVQAIEVDGPLKILLSHLPSPSLVIHRKLQAAGSDESHPFKKLEAKIERLLLRAGHPKNLNTQNFIDLSFHSFWIGALAAFLYSSSLDLPPLFCSYFGAIAGLALPWAFVNLAAGKRQIAIRKDLPYLLDLLTLCVESGMDFSTALIRIGPTLKDSPLGGEVKLLVTEMKMGKSRTEGLKDLSYRIGLMELSTVVNAIIQSDQLGASMGPALRIQSEDMRKKRILLAEESGMKAPVKLLFPLVVFIFPTTFAVLFAPMVIKLL